MSAATTRRVRLKTKRRMPDETESEVVSEIDVPETMTLLQLLDIVSYERGTIVKGDGAGCRIKTDTSEFDVAPATEDRTVELLCTARSDPRDLLLEMLVPYFGRAASIMISGNSAAP